MSYPLVIFLGLFNISLKVEYVEFAISFAAESAPIINSLLSVLKKSGLLT